MLLVGLTGNIASGKTQVAGLLRECGATVIDADELSRQVVAPGTRANQALAERWGREIVAADGSIDRTALRSRVFGDTQELEVLNEIVHPDIARLRDERIAEARARGDKIVVYVAPLLFERRLVDDFDKIILVDAPRELRFERLIRDRKLEEGEAVKMIASQMPAELKRARADYTIDNVAGLPELTRAVDAVWKSLQRDATRDAVAVS